jgi:hypothetical protein
VVLAVTLGALAAVVGCSGGSEPGYQGSLTFSWPKSCVVDVIESTERAGSTKTNQTSLTITSEGSTRRIAFNGDLMFRPTPIGAAQGTRTSTVELPPILVDSTGSLMEVVGGDGNTESSNIQRIAPGDASLPSSEWLRGAAAARVRSYWSIWVGVWSQLDTVTDGSAKRTLAPADGVMQPAGLGGSEVQIESLGDAPKGLAHLRLTWTVEQAGTSGDTFYRQVPTGQSHISSRANVVIDAVIDPTTLMATKITMSTIARFSNNGPGTVSQGLDPQSMNYEENSSFVFDWSTDGCS